MNDLNRLTNGLNIRRPKKKRNIMNDTRIKRCIARFDAGSYNRIQFLRAVSHSLGAHTDVFRPSTDNSDSDIDISVNQQSTPQSVPQTSSPTTDPPAQSAAAAAATPSAPETTCEVCLIASSSEVAFVPCGHARFCSNSVDTLCAMNAACPLCRTPITMVLRLF